MSITNNIELQQAITDIKQRFEVPVKYLTKEDLVVLSTFLNETNTFLYSIYLNITTVHDNITDVITVADNVTDVNIVADDIINVVRVSESLNNIDRIYTSIDEIDRLFESILKIDRVYTSIDNVDRLHTSIENIDRIYTSIIKLDRVFESIDEVDRVYLSTDNIDKVVDSADNIGTVADWLDAGGSAAVAVTYDNSTSGLTATNVQTAVDEMVFDTQTALDLKANQSTTYTKEETDLKIVELSPPTDISMKADIVDLTDHTSNTSNPHSVTKTQVGLSNVDNTSDSAKNVLSATKLTTTRTIGLSGDVSGSASFDGSGDATITATVANDSHNHTYLSERNAITYGASYLQWTDTSGQTGTGLNGSTPYNPTNDWYHHIIANHSNAEGYYCDLAMCFNDANHYITRVSSGVRTTNKLWNDGNDGSGSGLNADLLDGQQGSYYQPASSALTTSTTFGGDVSGTYNAIVVADDSHNHIISNVDDLEDALDAKQAILVSGTNIKTVNSTSVLGSGNIAIDEYTDADALAWFESYGKSLGSSGYQKLPSGLIIQWGLKYPTTYTTSANIDTTFPITFPNTCFSVVASMGINHTDYDYDSIYRSCTGSVSIANPTTTGVDMQAFIDNHTTSARRVQWIAVGY